MDSYQKRVRKAWKISRPTSADIRGYGARKAVVDRLLAQYGGNVLAAANALGVSVQTLLKWQRNVCPQPRNAERLTSI